MKKNVPFNHAPVNKLHPVITAIVIVFALIVSTPHAQAQTFVHPGGLHTQADLDRMKAKVAAGAHPWIDDWNILIKDSRAKNTYNPTPLANLGDSRQQADFDAHAAYLNALRWYISGDTTNAECAVRICNAWSAAVNQVPTGADIPGLNGLPTCNFALAAEILRLYPHWSTTDFNRFKHMMTTYLYPPCNDFLLHHQNSCTTHFFANWDLACIEAMMAMGVLCDDTAIFNQGLTYYKSGIGNGNIERAVAYVHPGNLGQWQESGRDQGHTQLGIGEAGYICQIAWNQGIDLFSYDNNRLLAGAEYVAQYNLWQDVPFQYYNDCVNDRHFYPSTNSRGSITHPVWELIYNHYAVLKGLNAPNTKKIAEASRPEYGGYLDHFGYGTLAFTLNGTASPYPPSPIPPVPTGLTATASVSRIDLQWSPSAGYTAQGYRVQRATTSGGPYTTIASWTGSTSAQYTDVNVTNDVTYYYVVAAINQSGTSSNTTQVSATPKASGALPKGWTAQDIGNVAIAGSTTYSTLGNNTYMVNGSGSGIDGAADSFHFAYTKAFGDIAVSGRLLNVTGTLSKTGIMIRESLSPGAKTVFVELGGRIAGLGTRATTNGTMTWITGDKFTWIPVWLKLERSGNSFTGYQSSDGSTWFSIGSTNIDMDSTYYVGLAASSAASALDNSTFDNVTIQNGKAVSSNNGLIWYVSGTRSITARLQNGSNEKYSLMTIDGKKLRQGALQSGKVTFNQLIPGTYVLLIISTGGTIAEKVLVP